MKRIKIFIAKRLSKIIRFIQYWSIQEQRENIHPTVIVETGTRIHDVSIDRYTYVGHDCFLGSGKIGAFCSISWNVTIGADEHPIDKVSKHPFWYSSTHSNIKADQNRWKQTKDIPIIGNDVWIGANAVILRGAIIEDGAVIAAGAVVNGYVPAYSIVGGVPAKIIKFQFDQETCLTLKEVKWWQWDEEKLLKNAHLFDDVNAFLKLLHVELGHAK
ncbi:MAG: CatB-related O-acetyltransferase [Paenibacillus lautus]|jgi:acetyltransferase-like isoleucine patch superfamily enzyme|uniref:CatB-related O-acetyltransferase n=1 Tax=Paenibacillus lautus TaxID=1401 RepID=UPI0026EA4879|nr:CatB-related O-acetyltransferase [Paenibacillus lautus]MCI1773931.1 CatB-related O-acetyltransferase [Paenibacillus lautus]